MAWRGGRVVECTALEMRHRCKPIGGSNPSLSATAKPLKLLKYRLLDRVMYPLVYPSIQHASYVTKKRLAIPDQNPSRR